MSEGGPSAVVAELEEEFPPFVVGVPYRKSLGNGSITPWLDNNATLRKQISENKWLRWDGVEGTAESHIDWMHEKAASLMSDGRRNEFREYGEKSGIRYFVHDGLTAEGRGYGFFKLEGTARLEPRDMVASMLDFSQIANSDKTIVLMKILETATPTADQKRRKEEGDGSIGKPVVVPAYWCNAPGFPFHYRDGVDLTGYKKDPDGVVWQLSVSARGDNFVSMPGALAATDRYWAYRLVPNGDGTTDITLICQTELNGWIPKALSNYMLCSVLIDYITTTEEAIRKGKESGRHQRLLKHLQLENL